MKERLIFEIKMASMRFLEESHDDHDHDEDHAEELSGEEDLTGLKILIVFLLLFAGTFVFFPYMDKINCQAKKK